MDIECLYLPCYSSRVNNLQTFNCNFRCNKLYLLDNCILLEDEMLLNKLFKTTLLVLISLFLFVPSSFAGFNRANTDTYDSLLFYYFDLRERESFVQVTNNDPTPPSPPPGFTPGQNVIVHVQIFNVDDNCNENNFYDTYTPNDTHVYNMRDILTNGGNPSGVVLPQDAYGIVSVGVVNSIGGPFNSFQYVLTGNIRILDNNGYEYRSNAQGVRNTNDTSLNHITFNFDTSAGIKLSDIAGIPFGIDSGAGEVNLADITDTYYAADIDIYNENEVVFSCRNVIFACTDQDNPLLEELLEESGSASVASFEYGINNAIPHSKGGELLCPGNIIDQGFVFIDEATELPGIFTFIAFVGLNNGNSRGTMDSLWYRNNNPSFW